VPTSSYAAQIPTEIQRILGTRSVPAEPGRIILALPPAEIATHMTSGGFTQTHANHDLLGLVLYLMCDDLPSMVEALKKMGVRCTEIDETEFGLKTTVVLPSGGEIGLYQPSHQTAISLGASTADDTPVR
jgi:hypothetical protein